MLGLSHQPRKRKSAVEQRIEEEFGAEMNSTGSILSELSLTQSEDDLLNSRSCKYKKHRPSLTHNNSDLYLAGERRSKISTDRKSGHFQKRNINIIYL